jgi:hypothetical protein
MTGRPLRDPRTAGVRAFALFAIDCLLHRY